MRKKRNQQGEMAAKQLNGVYLENIKFIGVT
jgi:hypothetical protein